MAEQILSQVEVDALLKGLSNGEIKTEAEKLSEHEGGVRPYDFINKEVSAGKMPAFDMINEKFSRSVRGLISNLLRKPVDFNYDGTRTERYEDFTKNLQVPSSLNLFQMSPLRGQGMIAIDPNLIYMIVESYFGGDGRFHTRIEGREFTTVEQAVIRKMVEILLNEMRDAWKALYPLDFKPTRMEMNPQFVSEMDNSDAIVISTFIMEVESVKDNIFMVLPYAALEPVMDKLHGAAGTASKNIDKQWLHHLNERLKDVDLTVSGEVGSAKVNFEEILNLKAGDIIQLDKRITDTLDIFIEGIAKFNGRAGIMDNNYALKILSPIHERG